MGENEAFQNNPFSLENWLNVFPQRTSHRHIRERARTALAPIPPPPPPPPLLSPPISPTRAWQGQTLCVDVWSDHGVHHMLWSSFAVLQPSFRFEKQGIGNSFILYRGITWPKRHGPKQQTSPRFFQPSVKMCQHCSRCVVVAISDGVPNAVHVVLLLARPFSSHCVFHVLFYSKRPNAVDWLQWLTGSTDVSIAGWCKRWKTSDSSSRLPEHLCPCYQSAVAVMNCCTS